MRNLMRALRSRNYRLLFTGQAISLTGLWIQITAQAWLMFQITGSNLAVGILGAAQTGPGLLIGPFAGALADRYNRQRLLRGCQLALLVPAAALAALTLGGWITPVQIVALALVTGIIRAFEIPARQAFLPEVVERADLPNAISLNSALFNGARMIGPATAGVVMYVWSEGWCFLINALSFLAPVAAISAIRLPRTEPRQRSGRSVLSEVAEGLRYVRGEPVAFLLLSTLALVSVIGMPYSVLLPAFTEQTLGGDERSFSALTSAAGAGAMLAALLLAARRGTTGLERVPALGGAAFGAALIALSLSGSLAVAMPLLALIGAGLMSQMTSSNTLLQLAVPDHLRGRVMAIHTALFLGVVPLGGLVAGTAADWMGDAPVLRASGVLLLIGALLLGRALVRQVEQRDRHSTAEDGSSLEPSLPGPPS